MKVIRVKMKEENEMAAGISDQQQSCDRKLSIAMWVLE